MVGPDQMLFVVFIMFFIHSLFFCISTLHACVVPKVTEDGSEVNFISRPMRERERAILSA